jgi:hypothetical protein
MGRCQERLRAKLGGIKLDERCAYCGNDQPGTLKHTAILASGMVTCRDQLACRQRREAEQQA